ncbi:MAG TPA: phosphate/phosphite/phosphonate ABC transporter substrate-binding protein [Acidobacteriota bacterium]|nr:phosphate/phosphite/phosphonate ABC transporter substrate-binding protein [Acidobacteriota bacterium]
MPLGKTVLHICLLAGAVWLLQSAVACCPSADEYVVDPETGERREIIKMGLVPSEDAEIVINEGEKMAALLSEKTGYPFRAYVTPNYNTLVAAMRAGDVDFAWLPPLAYVLSKLDGTGTVLLKAVRGENPFYYGAIIVRADSGIDSVDDLRGKVMGWGDLLSFSGHIFPKYDLIRKENYTNEFFSREANLSSHPAVVVAVLNGHIDAGAVWANDTEGNSGAWLIGDHADRSNEIKPIFYTDPIPGDTFTVRTGFMEEFPDKTERIRRAVVALADDPEGARILMTVYRITRMAPATDEDYRVVYDAFETVIRK